MDDVLRKIKTRTKEWKELFRTALETDDLPENPSWFEILRHFDLAHYGIFDTDDNRLQDVVNQAIKKKGIFDYKERMYLRSLPHYEDIINVQPLSSDNRVLTKFFPASIDLLVYTIETDRKDLWDLDILVIKPNLICIINYAREIPEFAHIPQTNDCNVTRIVYEYGSSQNRSFEDEELPF